MTDTETSQVEAQVKQAEFAFIVIKQKDGRFAIANVQNDETERQPSIEDIYNALASLQRDLDRQGVAQAVLAAMQKIQTSQASSGLIVPEKRFVKRGR